MYHTRRFEEKILAGAPELIELMVFICFLDILTIKSVFCGVCAVTAGSCSVTRKSIVPKSSVTLRRGESSVFCG